MKVMNESQHLITVNFAVPRRQMLRENDVQDTHERSRKEQRNSLEHTRNFTELVSIKIPYRKKNIH